MQRRTSRRTGITNLDKEDFGQVWKQEASYRQARNDLIKKHHVEEHGLLKARLEKWKKGIRSRSRMCASIHVVGHCKPRAKKENTHQWLVVWRVWNAIRVSSTEHVAHCVYRRHNMGSGCLPCVRGATWRVRHNLLCTLKFITNLMKGNKLGMSTCYEPEARNNDSPNTWQHPTGMGFLKAE